MALQVIGQYYNVPFGCKVMKHLTLIVFESGSTQQSALDFMVHSYQNWWWKNVFAGFNISNTFLFLKKRFTPLHFYSCVSHQCPIPSSYEHMV